MCSIEWRPRSVGVVDLSEEVIEQSPAGRRQSEAPPFRAGLVFWRGGSAVGTIGGAFAVEAKDLSCRWHSGSLMDAYPALKRGASDCRPQAGWNVQAWT